MLSLCDRLVFRVGNTLPLTDRMLEGLVRLDPSWGKSGDVLSVETGRMTPGYRQVDRMTALNTSWEPNGAFRTAEDQGARPKRNPHEPGTHSTIRQYALYRSKPKGA